MGEYISLAAVIISLLALVIGIFRNSKGDTKETVSVLTTLTIQYEAIKDGIKEIKTDIKEVKTDVDALKERATTTEQNLKAVWKQIEELKRGDDGR